MASSKEVDSRLNTTLKTPSGCHFSQVIAVTQGSINQSLLMLFNEREELAKVSIKHPVGKMEAELRSGTVTIPVDGNNLGTVYYHCRFLSGWVKLYDDDEGELGKPIDIKDWDFAFSIDISSINMDPNSPEYDAVKNVIHQPGDYSITRLYLDFNTARIVNFSEKDSSFNGRKWKNANEKGYFINLMQKWGNPNNSIMANPKNTTVGYAAVTDNPGAVNRIAPTFPPTSLIFQRYPYTPPEGKPHQGADEKGDRNMLLYLEMTDNDPLPSERMLLLNSGNFAIPGMGGTICISRKNFWDKFLNRGPTPGLQQLLRVFNEATFAWVKWVEVSDNIFLLSANAEYGVGQGSGLDSEKDFYAWEKDGNLGWKWEKSGHEKKVKGWEDAFDRTNEVWCNTSNKISIIPGKDVAKISGKTTLKHKVNSHTVGAGEGFEAVASMSWDLDLTLVSVHEGGMQITLDIPADKTELFKISSYQDSWPLNIHQEAAEHMNNSLKGSIERSPFDQVKRHLESALKGTARFVLPGAKTFFYKNAMFNNNGDVLLQLEYDGVS